MSNTLPDLCEKPCKGSTVSYNCSSGLQARSIQQYKFSLSYLDVKVLTIAVVFAKVILSDLPSTIEFIACLAERIRISWNVALALCAFSVTTDIRKFE